MAKKAFTRPPRSTAPVATARRKAYTSPAKKTDPDLEKVLKGEFTSNQVNDPFDKYYGVGQSSVNYIIEPPHLPGMLLRMINENAILRQCIEAYVTNIEGHGYRFAYIGPEGKEESDEAKNELEKLESFFDMPNEAYSMLELRERMRWDLESLGFAFIEVGRAVDGSVTALWHLPAQVTRITKVDNVAVPVKTTFHRKTGPVEQTVNKYFRRYVQMVGQRKVYFKEYGDPRKIDPATGLENPSLLWEQTATELLCVKLYNPGSVYGVPRWVNQFPAIKGSRQAELTNLEYFSDNAVPAAVVLVSGGSVNEETLNAVEDQFRSVAGRGAAQRIVVLEAVGDEHYAAENGAIPPPRIEIKPLQGQGVQDGKFMEYEKECHSKVRSAFRLPPIFLGLSEDYTYATAKTSFEVAESQIFGTERAVVDDVVNRQVLPTWGTKNWQYRSNPARLSDPQDVLNAVQTFDAAGALTPNIVVGLANEVFDLDIPAITEEWGNYPFQIVKDLASKGNLKGLEKIKEEVDAATQGKLGPDGKPLPPADPNDPNAKPGDVTEQTPVKGKPGDAPPPDEKKKQKVAALAADAFLELRTLLSGEK